VKVILFAKYFLVCIYNSLKKWQFFIHMRKLLLSKICSYKIIFFFSKNIMHINFSFKTFKRRSTYNLFKQNYKSVKNVQRLTFSIFENFISGSSRFVKRLKILFSGMFYEIGILTQGRPRKSCRVHERTGY